MKILDPQSTPPLFQPKTENRFIVTLGEPFKNIPSFCIKKINKPGVRTNYRNKLDWDPVYLSMYDPTTINISNIILEGISKLTSQEEEPYVNVHIDIVDPTGIVVEKWDIKTKFGYVDFGCLDWSSDDLSEISLTLNTINVKIQ